MNHKQTTYKRPQRAQTPSKVGRWLDVAVIFNAIIFFISCILYEYEKALVVVVLLSAGNIGLLVLFNNKSDNTSFF